MRTSITVLKMAAVLPMLIFFALVMCAGCRETEMGKSSRSEQHVNVLVEKLNTGSQKEKIEAANTLADLEEKAAPAVPQLIEIIEQANSWFDPVEIAASRALIRIGRPAALGLLEKVKQGPTRISTSSMMGSLAHLVVPELAELSRSLDEKVRTRAVELLAEGGEDAASVLGEALRDIEESVKRAAAHSLRRMGSAAVGALPDLISAVERRDPDVIGDLVEILGQIGPPAKDALPALRSLGREEKMPKGMNLSSGLRESIEKSIKKIEGRIRDNLRK